jgi:hypothetical protein
MRNRGQTMVLFALTMLLLVLMVTMTLSIGMKVREKIELQTVADAAAYSNAVATARSFNAISLMNRALMGHMVAMTGVESLISWSSYYRATLHGARQAYDQPYAVYSGIAAASCPCAPTNAACARLCQCSTRAMSDISQAQNKLQQEDQKLESTWQGLDRAAGLEARGLQISSISDEQKALYDQLESDLENATLAGSIAKESNKGAAFGEELEALSNGALKDVIAQEIAGGESCGGNGAACTRRNAGKKLHFIYAAMGSRGFSFVTGRGEADFIRMKLQSLLPSGDLITSLTNEGSSYFPAEGSKTHSAQTIDGTELWGDDHGNLGLLFGRGQAPCPPMLPGTSSPEAHVRSNHQGDTSDEHRWTGGQDNDSQPHTMGTCTQCPGIWPPHMDYNYKLVTDSGNNWGQPKSYAVIQRDYSKRPDGKGDPWNLFFRFRTSSSGSGTVFDNRGIKLSPDVGGTDISKATALSAGITYYKRAGDHWQEPPNFLNPFWRATLVSAQVDLQGEQDMEKVLNESASFSAEVYKALKDKGYSAW